MLDIGKHTKDQFVLTINVDDHKVPTMLTRKELLILWDRIADLLVYGE